jgi:hypothetical protein
MPNDLSPLRRSQVVGTYGPGAVVDFRGQKGGTVSVVTAGLDAWDDRARKPGLGHDQVIFEPRLQNKLGVAGFRLPPVTPEIAPGVPAKNADILLGVRFPSWLQCPDCHVLKRAFRWDAEPAQAAPLCRVCGDERGKKVHPIPVRFIVTCANGHLDEFPWERWAQHAPHCERRKPLSLVATNVAGLAGLMLSCTECGERKSMEGCFSTEALKGVMGRCHGHRPWLPGDSETCDAPPTVVQRGASNLYFPVVDSALDIPPWSDRVQKVLENHWQDLLNATPDDRPALIRILKLHERVGRTVEELVKLVEERARLLTEPTNESIRWEEWAQLTRHDQPFGAHEEFEGHPERVPDEMKRWVGRITVLSRLREVRAIRGFTRVTPPAGEHDPRIAKISAQPKTWLPAIEVRGEGIFIALDGERLTQWETQPDVIARVATVAQRYAARQRGEPREITPRLLLLHSVAHALIRQLSLDCGYSASSLRERLYVGHGQWDMAGLLIYTASADADGTLGGLARQGRTEALMATLTDGLRNLEWCSSDPLCIEGRASLSHQLNLAACHACMLASETSCEEFNVLLDRALLVGTPTKRHLGFFRDYLDADANEGL